MPISQCSSNEISRIPAFFTSFGNTPKALNNKAKGRAQSERTLGWQAPQRY
jgi:hypothetical protein